MGLFSTWPSVKKKAQPSPCSYHPPQVTHWIDLSQGEIRASPQFIIIFYLSSLMQFLPGWVCCEKVEWNQAFHFAAKWDQGEALRGEGKTFLIRKGKCATQSFHRMLPSLPIRMAETNSGVIIWNCLSSVTQPLFFFMSIIYLFCCATQFVCIFSPVECLDFIVYIFWPPTNRVSN